MNAGLSLFIITALVPVACAQDTRITTKQDIVYVEPASSLHTLDVYASPSAKNAPVVFWIHGGGWQTGDKSDVAEKPRFFVNKGFVFVSVNYRLLPKVEMVDIFRDVTKSFRWVHDHIAEYGGDSRRVLVGGHSAGAQLAALICTDDRYLTAEGIAFTDLIGCVPVDGDTYDVPAIIETEETRCRVYGQPLPRFGHREKFGNTAEKHRDYSAVTHVTKDKGIAPFLILHVADHPDTSAQAFRLGTVLKAAGVKTTVFGAKETSHSKLNDNLGVAGDPATKALQEFVDGCLGQAATRRPTHDLRKQWKLARMDEAKAKEWRALWEKNIIGDERNRYCDKAVGEDIAWLMTPFMEGFYYGFRVTGDTKWVDKEVDWADSLIKRAVKEPDGFMGWPGMDPHGTQVDGLDRLFGDSMLGDAMVFRPIVLMSGEILKRPALKEKYGAKAESYLKLAEELYKKWDRRGGWRQTEDGGLISVVGYYGLDKDGNWTAGPEARQDPKLAFSHPDNKANHVARWMLAMWDVTGKDVYREHAQKWFMLLKGRLNQKTDGTYELWNYWEPAGPWDYKPDGRSPKHWVGVHPRGGYYEIDLLGIVDAYEHGLVFTRRDLDDLIATGKALQRPWSALVPYCPEFQAEFERTIKPDSWGGLASAPFYLWCQDQLGAGGTK